MKHTLVSMAFAFVLFASPARAQSRPEPVGAVFCTLVATLAGSIAALMFSPILQHDDGNTVVGATMVAVGATSLSFGISLTVPRERVAVRVAANGVTIHW